MPESVMTNEQSDFDDFRGILDKAPEALRYDNVDSGPGDAHMLLAAWIPEGATVLDVGAGTGAFAEMLKRTRGADVTCLEPDSDRAALARQRGLTVHTCTVAEFKQQSNRRFDVAVLADVLEHIPYPAPILGQLRSLLKDGGHLLISVPNVAHWTVRVALMRGRFDYEAIGPMDATHLRWFTSKSLRRVLVACGYVVEAQVGTVGEWYHPYKRWPWTLIPAGYRYGVIRRLVGRFHGAFALQHVVRARAVAES